MYGADLLKNFDVEGENHVFFVLDAIKKVLTFSLFRSKYLFWQRFHLQNFFV